MQIKRINSIYPKKDKHNIAKEMYNSLKNRFSNTINMEYPCYAYLLTGSGLRILENDSDEIFNLAIKGQLN